MSALSVTLAAQRAAEARMLDEGKASRPTGGYEYDEATQSDVEAADDLFTSRCEIKAVGLVSRETEVGGRTQTVMRYVLKLPASAPALNTGDLWEMTAVSSVSLSPVGRIYRIQGPADGAFASAARYEVEVLA